jgi:agmatinase
MPTFLPEDSLRTPRFVGITTFMRLPHTRQLDGVDVAVLGIPFDTGSPFRVGCRFGPAAIRAMSLMLRPINPYQDLNVFEECAIVDYGDTDVAPGYLPESFERIEAAMAPLVARDIIPVGLGGDHSIALPELRALGRRHGALAVLHFDSHTDTWDTYFAAQRHSAGTAFRRASRRGSSTRERRCRSECAARSSATRTSSSRSTSATRSSRPTRCSTRASRPSPAHPRQVPRPQGLPVVRPGRRRPRLRAGRPDAGGRRPLRARHPPADPRLRGLDLVGADVVEMNPNYDPAQISALLAATVAAEILALIAAHRRDRKAR